MAPVNLSPTYQDDSSLSSLPASSWSFVIWRNLRGLGLLIVIQAAIASISVSPRWSKDSMECPAVSPEISVDAEAGPVHSSSDYPVTAL